MGEERIWVEILKRVRVKRAVYFYRFHSFSTVLVEEQITYENASDDSINYLPYTIDEFKNYFCACDTDGEQLEFFNYSDNKYHMVILLPKNKWIDRGERKTIRVSYIKDSLVEKSPATGTSEMDDESTSKIADYSYPLIKVHLLDTGKTYVNFEKYKNYDIKVECFMEEGMIAPEPKMVKMKGTTYASFLIDEDPDKRSLIFKYGHIDPPRPTPSRFDSLVGYLGWHNFGLLIGAASIVLIIVMKMKALADSTYDADFADVATLAALTIATLTIIEGWLFDKDKLLDPQMIKKYDFLYKLMIALLLIEMALFI